MRASYLGIAIVIAVVLAAPAPAGAWTPRWFVELASAPAADGTSTAALDAERTHFEAQAREAGVALDERYTYRTLFNGVSIAADDTAIERVGALDGVAAVYPVGTVSLSQAAPAFTPEFD